ncbi:MAG TPA: Spy/CpxP family protein refolding chaperone [Gemmatimonadaceae bacterium]|jgi:Spy/CpxP family protein refolding chaperone
MSTIRTVALGALMIAGFAGVSGAQASSSTPRTRPDSGWHRRGPGGAGQAGGERGGRGEFGFARNLNLTDAQKTQIKAIRQKYQPQNQALRDRAKPFMEAARAARQKGDTAAVRSNMLKAREVMQSGQSFHTQENAEIRNVLTADQRVKFDAWQKQMADRRAQGGRGGKGFGRKGGADRAGK